jgi:hypothetical protein
VVLTLFHPFEVVSGDWKCVFGFDPPMKPTGAGGRGPDIIGAVVHALAYSRLYAETMSWWNSAHWQGVSGCGLPASGEQVPAHQPPQVPPPEVNPGNLAVFATRTLGRPDDSGIEIESTLTTFTPSQVDGVWKCAFTFGPPEGPVRHGSGADFIEALLDALSLARVTYESTVPEGWAPRGEGLLTCADLPVKIGRSFWV